MDTAARTFLFDLLNTPSPTGFELPGQRKWAAYTRRFADRVENDAYGTAWAVLEGGAKKPRRVMLEAHADEIGFIIKYITKEGWLRLDRIGGSDTATARGRRIDFLGAKGLVPGIIGNTAIHLRKDSLNDEKAPKIHELYVDVGANSAVEVTALGLRVGHPAVYHDAAEPFGKNRIVGRALDNRLGGFIIAEVLARLSRAKKKPRATLFAVNAVMEEIGGHGAKMAAHRLRPDVCVVLDVTHATETPGIDAAQHGESNSAAVPPSPTALATIPPSSPASSIARRRRKSPFSTKAVPATAAPTPTSSSTRATASRVRSFPSRCATCTASLRWPTSRMWRKSSPSSPRSSFPSATATTSACSFEQRTMT